MPQFERFQTVDIEGGFSNCAGFAAFVGGNANQETYKNPEEFALELKKAGEIKVDDNKASKNFDVERYIVLSKQSTYIAIWLDSRPTPQEEHALARLIAKKQSREGYAHFGVIDEENSMYVYQRQDFDGAAEHVTIIDFLKMADQCEGVNKKLVFFN